MADNWQTIAAAARGAVGAANTSKEIWRETPGDYYAPSIYAQANGGIGINVGGCVIVMTARQWHRLGLIPGPTAEDMAQQLPLTEAVFDVMAAHQAGQPIPGVGGGPTGHADVGAETLQDQLDALRQHVWQHPQRRDMAAMRAAAAQLAATALRFVVEVCNETKGRT